jgi:uncharacterized protein (TIGR02145 family)
MKLIFAPLIILIFCVSSFSQQSESLLDVRDGKVYETVKIENQVWMAENLNYQTRGSSCYDDKTENCDKYGRIYIWPLVMMTSQASDGKGICPEGWHVPTNEEWQILVETVKKTKALVTGGTSGFNLLFGGSKFTDGTYGFVDQSAAFWTASEDEGNDKFAWTWYMYEDKLYKAPVRYSTNKMYGQSLRCVKD